MGYDDDLEYAARLCAHCGECAASCDIMAAISPNLPGDMAQSVLDGVPNERFCWFIPRCSLCGLCTKVCSREINVPAMIKAARFRLLQQGLMDAEKYRAMSIDKRWNAITLYRNQYAIDLSDLEGRRGDIAFLPSCTLVNDAPEVVRATHAWLESALGVPVSLVCDCCGMPLDEMGLEERYQSYEDALWEKICSMGVSRLIVACPNCLGRLAHRGSRVGVRIQLVYELMATMGLRAPTCADEVFVVHDSCPARGGDAGRWVRKIMGDNALLEAEHCLDESRCCGSGGAVGMYDSVLSGLRSKRRIDELLETGASTVVTYCMSSCSALHAACTVDDRVHHVLEIVFSKRVSHTLNQQKVAALWEGENAAFNDSLLRSDEVSLPEIKGFKGERKGAANEKTH